MTTLTKFVLENSPEFEGYDEGRRWNGWACPTFTREQADKVATWWNTQPGCVAEWDSEHDGYAFICEGWDEPDCFLPDYLIQLGEKTWAIGAGSWCWNRHDDFEK